MDYILWAVVAVAQVLVGFLGILSIKSDFAGQHFKTFVVAFAVLSIVGLIASGWGVVRATNASNQIAQLQQDTLYAIEGSPDSYAEIVPVFDETSGGSYEQGIVTFTLRNGAKHPMMDTDVWVTGVRHLDFSAFGV